MHASKSTTVLIARFDDLLSRGLRQVIDGDASLEVVADDVEHERWGVVLRAHRPRVAILDVDVLSSLAEVRLLSEAYPDVRLVLLASHATMAECGQALAFGASAFLARDTQARDVLTAIHLASRGLQLIPRSAHDGSGRPLPGPQLLTQREAEVLPMLQQGGTNMQIAVALHVGVETIRTHARNIYRKLGVSSRRELGAPSRRELPTPPRAPARDEDYQSLPARRKSDHPARSAAASRHNLEVRRPQLPVLGLVRGEHPSSIGTIAGQASDGDRQ
jgi:DNA-binding NarL/FixJ family response regulator